MAPRDEEELRCMLLAAHAYGEGPIAVRFPRGSVVGVSPYPERKALEIGRGELLRAGADASIIAIGSMVSVALAAAEILERAGMAAGVIDAKFLKPLDRGLIRSAAAGGRPVLVLEENAVSGGLGSAILELCADSGLAGNVALLGIPDRFIPHGKREALLAEFGLSADAIAARLRDMINARRTAEGGTR